MILNEFFDSNKKHSPQQWLAEGLDAEAYKQKLLSSLPGMMRFFEKNVQGWRPSREQMLAAIETGYTVMKHTGDVKQAGRAVMDELNTLHRMSQGEQDVAEGKMAELEMDLEDPEITDRQFEKMYGMTRKEAREQFSQTDMWAFPEIRDPNQPLHERGVVEAFGPLPKDNQQIRLGRHTVNIERVGLDKNYISFAWHDSKGQEHYEEVAVGDLGSYDDLIKRIKQEISYQERKYTDQGVTEGLNEMDKSAPQPGRDGKVSQSTYGSRDKKSSDYFKGKEAPGKAITAKQASKDALDILKKQGVAEGSNDTIYPNAEVIKSKNGRPVGEIYQDGNSWGCFHYRADRGYDMIDTRADAIQALKDLHQETGRSGPDNTFKGVAEAINPDITNPAFSHQQQIGDYLYVAKYWGRRKTPIGLKISAYHGNKLIGYADLMYHSAPFDDFADPETTPNRIWLESEITKVNPKYQRQGIMSTMYAYAKMLGNSVKPSELRSPDAKAAWSSWRQAGDAKHLTSEGDDPWGPQGNFAGDKHVDVGGVTMTIIQVGDIVKYLGQKAEVVALSKDRKRARITIQKGMGGITKDVNTSDLTQFGQGVTEVSDATKQSYTAKAQAQVKELEPHANKGEYRDIAQRAIDRRQRGLNRLANRSDAVAAQAQLPAPAQRTADQSDLFRDIIDVVPRAVTPTANGTNRNPMISSLDQEITDIFQPAANDDEAQRQANAESRDPQRAIAHTDFDDPEWHEKVRRVGQRAQQGPLKTVWDPVKRVYRNVPVDQPANKKPNMNEARLHRRAVLRQILES